MKAWLITIKDCFGSTIVFAETRGKAKSLALYTDLCYSNDAEFTDIEVRRLRAADSQYRQGKTEMDWFDPKDRLFLVKELGFRCEYVVPDECKVCSARTICERYEDFLNEEATPY